MRVQKIISNAGYCSRRKAEEYIQEGRVKVNGKPITIGDSAEVTDLIEVDGQSITIAKSKYVLLNKPKNYVTALSDAYEKTISDLIRVDERVYPAGRLDKDAEGLLILTNNGDIANKIMHPSYEIKKKYIVHTKTEMSKEVVDLVNKNGVVTKDGWVNAKIKRIGVKTYSIVLHVGHHKVVKKIFDTFDVRVDRLIRTEVGPLKLGKLKSGTHQVLTDTKAKEFEEYILNLKPHTQKGAKEKKKDFYEAYKKLSDRDKRMGLKLAKEKPKRTGKNRIDHIRIKEEKGSVFGKRDKFEPRERSARKTYGSKKEFDSDRPKKKESFGRKNTFEFDRNDERPFKRDTKKSFVKRFDRNERSEKPRFSDKLFDSKKSTSRRPFSERKTKSTSDTFEEFMQKKQQQQDRRGSYPQKNQKSYDRKKSNSDRR
ncbi:MAG: pseudouridine synthase [Candidatus Woesearchaeota archaeon]